MPCGLGEPFPMNLCDNGSESGKRGPPNERRDRFHRRILKANPDPVEGWQVNHPGANRLSRSDGVGTNRNVYSSCCQARLRSHSGRPIARYDLHAPPRTTSARRTRSTVARSPNATQRDRQRLTPTLFEPETPEGDQLEDAGAVLSCPCGTQKQQA